MLIKNLMFPFLLVLVSILVIIFMRILQLFKLLLQHLMVMENFLSVLVMFSGLILVLMSRNSVARAVPVVVADIIVELTVSCNIGTDVNIHPIVSSHLTHLLYAVLGTVISINVISGADLVTSVGVRLKIGVGNYVNEDIGTGFVFGKFLY